MEPNANKETNKMSETTLVTTIKALIESQERRDQAQGVRDNEFRKGIAKNSEVISSLIPIVEDFKKDKEYLFGFHNDNMANQVRSSKEQWRAVMQGLGYAAFVMAAILAPLGYNIFQNKDELKANHVETRAMFKETLEALSTLKAETALNEQRQFYAEVINALGQDRQNILSGAWVDEQGGIAHPARHFIYQPVPPRR